MTDTPKHTHVRDVVPFVPTAALKSVRTSCTAGRFNWASNEEQDCVAIRLEFEDGSQTSLDTTWDAGDSAPFGDDWVPSELTEILSTRIESYWISTSRTKDRGIIDWIRENALIVDRAFIVSKVAEAEAALDRATKTRDRWQKSLRIMDIDIAEAAAEAAAAEGGAA